MSEVLLEVVTPDHIVVSRPVMYISLRGGGGDLGILPRHTPLATTVPAGIVRVRVAAGEDYIVVTDGFLHVMPDRVTLLVKAAEIGALVDTDRADQARRRAEQRLAERTATIDVARAEAALARARLRLEAAELSGRAGGVLVQSNTHGRT